MATIAVDQPVLTLINTFTVAPENQDALVRLLSEATEQVMQHLPGFVSASIHTSADGKHVANYAQWRSQADFEAMQQNPKAKVHMQQAAKLAERFEPLLYAVASTHSQA